MGKIIWGMALLCAMAGIYVWANATVPGGEKRYEQYMRLKMEQSGSDSFARLMDR